MPPLELPNAPGHPYFWLLKALFWLPLKLLGPTVTINKSAVPKQGGVIILANHLSDSDPVVLQFASPRPIQFMSKSELWDMKIIGPMLKWWGGFAVRRGEPDRSALRIAAELAKKGSAVGIYPEGQLSEDGQLQEIRPGVALIIKLSGAPVICCGLKHTDKIIPYGSVIPRPAFRRVFATWGEATTFNKEASNEEIVSWIEAEFRRLTS
jgi:1-acyl-sn-glycerol-3-phosphate acyltransferase